MSATVDTQPEKELAAEWTAPIGFQAERVVSKIVSIAGTPANARRLVQRTNDTGEISDEVYGRILRNVRFYYE